MIEINSGDQIRILHALIDAGRRYVLPRRFALHELFDFRFSVIRTSCPSVPRNMAFNRENRVASDVTMRGRIHAISSRRVQLAGPLCRPYLHYSLCANPFWSLKLYEVRNMDVPTFFGICKLQTPVPRVSLSGTCQAATNPTLPHCVEEGKPGNHREGWRRTAWSSAIRAPFTGRQWTRRRW